MAKGTVRAAPWWIETGRQRPRKGAEISEAAGVSVFHLKRSFAPVSTTPAVYLSAMPNSTFIVRQVWIAASL